MNKSLIRRGSNRLLHLLARFLPGSTSLRPLLHRMRGVRIDGRVFIGDDVYLENEYPECVEIHDGAEIGLRSIIIAHTRGAGEVVIGKDVLLGAGVIIACPTRRKIVIGEGAVITAGSVVTTSVDPFILCGAPRISALAKITVPFTMDTGYDEFVRGLRPIRKAK
jgi:hypothetical protein